MDTRRKMSIVGLLAAILFSLTPAWADLPEQSGPFVYRYESVVGGCLLDREEGVWITFGFDAVETCSGGGSTEPLDFWEIQEVYLPAEVGLLSELWKGDDIRVTLWPWLGPGTGACTCTAVLRDTPLASGTVDAMYTDNDLEAFLFDHDRYNAVGVMMHGILTDQSGDRIGLQARFRCVYGTDSQSCVSMVRPNY